ncbi:MAG TPA: fibronectin type III domain-containing protein [Bacteriovoracaceae bacterium]|nr:fibronectin type III domain-containing protein [Bacteriovoracaceae bacterium]
MKATFGSRVLIFSTLLVLAGCNGVAILITPPPFTSAPNGLEIVVPVPARETPTVRISGVESGDTVRLFTDSSCTTEVAVGIATGSTVDLTTSTLAPGNYVFYSNSTNDLIGVSACSSVNLPYSAVPFAGISSTVKTDSTLRLNWTADTLAVTYVVYRIVAGSPVFDRNVVAPAATVTLTGLTPDAVYTYRVKAKDSTNLEDSNTQDVTVTMNHEPDMPTTLTLNTPVVTRESPSIRVAGVKNGDTVRLFTNSLCTAVVGVGVATGATIDIATNPLPEGAHLLYANSTNPSGFPSLCTSSNLAYVSDLFDGVDSITNVTDSTLSVNWTADTQAVSFRIYRIISGTPTLVNSTPIPSTQTSYQLGTPPAPLAKNTSYTYRVRAVDINGNEDTNIKNITVVTLLAPVPPSAFSLVLPGAKATPKIRISGVKTGDTVRLYTGPGCSSFVTLAVAAGPTIDLNSNTITLPGTYTFHATATNPDGDISACSTANLVYKFIDCPTGYVQVLDNSTFGISSPFCVMKFEAKNVAGVPVSQASGLPWDEITQSTAKAACDILDTDPGYAAYTSGDFDLISNPEWMTMAHEIEKVATNWTSGVIGTGALYRGHSDSSSSGLEVFDETLPYDGTGNAASDTPSGFEQRRTLNLALGEVIWDLSGNVSEWVDWSLGGVLDSGPTSCATGEYEIPLLVCGALATANYAPANPAGIVTADYDNTYNLGSVNVILGSGGAASRGGHSGSNSVAGLFNLDLTFIPSEFYTTLGFRCVYRP